MKKEELKILAENGDDEALEKEIGKSWICRACYQDGYCDFESTSECFLNHAILFDEPLSTPKK